MIVIKRMRIVAAVAAALMLSSCSDGLTYEQKISELRKAGERGADAHYLLLTEHSEISKQVCEEHYYTFAESAPNDRSGFLVGRSQNWEKLHEQYFVDSCLAGEAREPKTRPTTSESESAPTSTSDVDDASDGNN